MGGPERGADRTIRSNEGKRLAELFVVERPAEALTQPARSVERPQHRQRVDALDQVVAGGLAELLVGGDDVEHVVDDLERHAVAVAVAR